MRRHLIALLIAGLAGPTGPAAPRLKDRETDIGFYPTTSGATWVMVDNGQAEHTFTVTSVEAVEGGILADVAEVHARQPDPCQQMLISKKGVFRLSVGGNKFTTPECLLKLPHSIGQTWEFETAPGAGSSKLTAIRREEIEVPAGKFDVVRVEREGSGPATYWFVERIGLVKVTYPGGERVLKSFTLEPK
jgi:hypothetical protein